MRRKKARFSDLLDVGIEYYSFGRCTNRGSGIKGDFYRCDKITAKQRETLSKWKNVSFFGSHIVQAPEITAVTVVLWDKCIK